MKRTICDMCKKEILFGKYGVAEYKIIDFKITNQNGYSGYERFDNTRLEVCLTCYEKVKNLLKCTIIENEEGQEDIREIYSTTCS